MAYNTRKKSIQFQQDTESDLDYSESGSEYEASSSSSTADEDLSEHGSDTDPSFSAEITRKCSNISLGEPKFRRGKNTKESKIYTIKSDDYFSNSSQKKVLLSSNVLDQLETPRLQQDQLQHLLTNKQLMIKHPKNLKQLESMNQQQYNRWLYFMHEGFNILLYGLGSKIEILNNFQKTYLKDMPVLVVNGFFPSLTIKNVVDSILLEVLELNENPGNIYDACDAIAQELSYFPTMHLYLIIHNIEGDMLKSGKTQNILSKLASIKNIHLIASIDHVSAPLIWDNSKLSKFNFLWFLTTTFLPYTIETSFEGSMIIQRSKSLALSSLNNVFLSLTSNSKGIYLIIVKHQLENAGNPHYQGFLFKDLYWACREAFLVSSDLALRSQLTEFVDHKMVKFKRSMDGSEYLIIPIATNVIEQFYEEHSK